MPKRITIEPHLSVEELYCLYRQTSDPIERTRYQIIWLLASGSKTSEVAVVTGYCLEAIRKIARRYNELGSDGLRDRRHQHPGAEPLISDVQQAQLLQVLCEPPGDGGLWNGRKVADWIGELIERPVARQRGWEYLRQLKFRFRTPRRSHQDTDDVEQEQWKKKLASYLQEIQTQYPEATVELWAMDEHRLGLKPVIRDIWVSEWEPPVAKVNWRFKWLWLYGFVHPESGDTYWWILPRVNIQLFNRVLSDFAQYYQVGPQKRIILAIDRAGWHESKKVKVPEGLHLVFLPSHSPELQPAERLWPLTNEGVANRCFETLEHLELVLYQRLKALIPQLDLIRGLTCFHWWPRTNFIPTI